MTDKAIEKAAMGLYENRIPHVYLVAEWAARTLGSLLCPHKSDVRLAAHCHRCRVGIVSLAVDAEKYCYAMPSDDQVRKIVLGIERPKRKLSPGAVRRQSAR